MLYPLARTALFRLPPETAHDAALAGLKRAHALGLSRLYAARVAPAPCTVMGLEFPNPVGLAAGLDKNGDYIDALAALGFGFIEIGTVTPRPQPGNPPPRLFRIPAAEALINRLGFNNKGVDYLVAQVRRSRYAGVLGINIGKNRDTPNEQALDDYLHCLDRVYDHASYVAVNISSPNTAGLRDLQQADTLDRLVGALLARRDQLADRSGSRKPLLMKVAPDLDADQVGQIAQVFNERRPDGVIATNTTIDHSAVADLPHGEEVGGLSGRPLAPRATEVLRGLRRALSPDIPLIGVGGIVDDRTAADRCQAGAALLQIYTGFIYHGPALIAEASQAFAAATVVDA